MDGSILNTKTMQSFITRAFWGNERIKVLNDNIIDSMNHTEKHEKKDLEFLKVKNFREQLDLTHPGHIPLKNVSLFKELNKPEIIDPNEELVKIQSTYMNNQLILSSYKRIYAMFMDVLK